MILLASRGEALCWLETMISARTSESCMENIFYLSSFRKKTFWNIRKFSFVPWFVLSNYIFSAAYLRTALKWSKTWPSQQKLHFSLSQARTFSLSSSQLWWQQLIYKRSKHFQFSEIFLELDKKKSFVSVPRFINFTIIWNFIFVNFWGFSRTFLCFHRFFPKLSRGK